MDFSILQFCQKCSILSFCERTVDFFASSILSKCSILSFCERPLYFFRFLNFVKNAQFCHFLRGLLIFWFFNFVKNAQFCHFVREESVFFFHFFNFVKNGSFCHFWKVDFKLWDKHKYTMCTLCVVIYQTIFVKNAPFVILWEARVFFRFFNFVKNAQFCHFVRGPWIFSLLQFCQKCSILSFSARGKCIFFSLFQFCKNGSFCHFWKVDFKLWDKHKYTMSTHYVLWYSKLFLSKMLNFVILWEARVFFRFFNFVKNAQFCHFLREESVFFSLFQFCQKWSILSFLKSGLQIMR